MSVIEVTKIETKDYEVDLFWCNDGKRKIRLAGRLFDYFIHETKYE